MMDEDDYHHAAVACTGIKITNRGQRISDNWGYNNKNGRKGY
jgi:hypothetical protein